MSKQDANDIDKSNLECTALEGVPLLNTPPPAREASDPKKAFPGHRRNVNVGPPGPPQDHTLVPTAGNALQAVPNAILEQSKNIVRVSVPENVQSGDPILVHANGKLI